MAKKKATHNQEKQEDNTLKPHNKDPKPAMTLNNMGNEASMEKLESLKSLNTMLLKEAVERRQQVASLMQVKGSLESEISRSNSEKEGLMSDLTQLNEEFFRLEMERSVVCSFVELQVGQLGEAFERERDGFWREKLEMEKKMQSLEREMREVLREKDEIKKENAEKDGDIEVLNREVNGLVNEIGKERDASKMANQERDVMRVKLDHQIEEAKGLRSKLIETEKRENGIKNEFMELEVKFSAMMEEKEENDRRMNAIMREKGSIERSLLEANKAIEEMKGKVEEIVREKEGIQEVMYLENLKSSELERAVSELKETVLSLQKEEKRLCNNVAELEKKCVEGVEKQKEMGREINELVKEKKESKKKQDRLLEDKVLVENDLNEALKRLDEQKGKMEELVNEKIASAEDKDTRETIILELQKELEESRGAIRKLENSSKGQMGKIKNLESEIGNYKDELKQVTVERDEARKGFNEEKQNGLAMKVKSDDLKKKIEKTIKLVEEMKSENVNIIAKKEELESRCEVLKKEIACTENSLAEVQKELDALRGKVELENSDSERYLSMLRSTVESVCLKDEKKVSERGREGTEPYVAALESIKNAFKNRENKVEDMKKQLVFLQNSVVEARKKKSFLTSVFSATTLFAAISLAYIACGR